jgi:LDH2 family malate/lactate/ureidoglycolate dehydrogenase
MLAINPGAFVGQQEFETEVKDFLNYVKSSRVAPGFTEILIPGEPENRERERRMNEGIFVEDKTWDKITEILDELEANA